MENPFVPSLLIARLPVKHNSEGHRLFRKTNANLKFAVIESESRGDRYVQEEDLAENDAEILMEFLQ